uniref:hypothetical protein n=1 Tax=uncultured Pseudokineococcus sp. TaxID=1642928 RepID=UPI00262A689E
GVGNLAFLPWAVTNWAGFLFSALIAVLAPVTGGFSIRRLDDADAHAHRSASLDARTCTRSPVLMYVGPLEHRGDQRAEGKDSQPTTP